MATASDLLGKLPVFQGRRDVVKENQNTGDIIAEILKGHAKYAADYDKISGDFRRSTVRDTCRAIYDFLVKNVEYRIEPDAVQSVKSPSAIIAQGYGDCKHYASFINGVLDSLRRKGMKGFEPVYRFASYDWGKTDPGHVFAVVLWNGRELWVDPVPLAGGFDSRSKEPTYFKDKKMSLVNISGIGEVGAVGKFRPFKALKKVGLAPSRNSFLLILKLNLFNLAYKIKQQIAKGKGAKYQSFWEKAGGNYKVFLKNVEQGAKKRERKLDIRKAPDGSRSIHGIIDEPDSYGMAVIRGIDGIGILPAAAAAVAAATPLIVMVVKLLKGDGVDVDEAGAAVQGAAESISGIYDDNLLAGICGIAGKQARKAKRAQKKAARQVKRTARKTNRVAKRTARKEKRAAKKAAKGAGGGSGFSDAMDSVATGATVLAAGASALSTATANASDSSGLSSGSGSNGGSFNSLDTGGMTDVSAEGGSDAFPESGSGAGFGIDGKTILLGAAAVAAVVLIPKLTKKTR